MHAGLASVQLKRGDAAGARKSLDVALLFDSTLAEVHFNLGLLHQSAGEGVRRSPRTGMRSRQTRS